MTAEGVQIFADAWSLYDQVLDRNYMFHDEIRRDVAGLIAERYSPGCFRVLDLGCGNARHVAGALSGCMPSLYAGYDLSKTALSQARTQLAALGCPSDLRQADLFDALHPRGGTFELIVSSFAVHHLSTADKTRFLHLARRRLAVNGTLMLVDVCREPDEDRPVYLDRYCSWIQGDWTCLSTAERDTIEDHVRTFDFPENNEDLHGMAASAGFTRCVD